MPEPKPSFSDRAGAHVKALAQVYDGVVNEMRARGVFGVPETTSAQGLVTPALAFEAAKSIWYRAVLEGGKKREAGAP